ncbi:MAG: hypothetical protein ACREIU_05485 [Planctomycetota bacterium]
MGAARIPTSHRLGLLLALLAAAVYFSREEWNVAGRLGLPLDDAWIHAALARNIAEGHSLAPNPGDPVVPCSTAPLWTLLEAGLLAGTSLLGAGSDPNGTAAIVASKVLGLASGYLAILLLWRLVRTVTGSLPLAFLGGALLATQARFVWGVLSGLEVPLYTCLVLLGLDLHLRFRDEEGWRRHLPLPVFAASVFSRPECLLFFPILWLDRVLFGKREARTPRRLAADAAASLAALVLFPSVNLLLWGRPFPTTYYVKAEPASLLTVLADEGARTAASYLGMALVQQALLWFAYFPALFLPLAFAAGRGGVRLLSEPGRRATVLPLAFLAFPLLHGLLAGTNPALQSGRRFFMIPPLFLATALAGLGPLRLPRAGRIAAAATSLAAASVAAAILAGFDPGIAGSFARYFYLGESSLGETPLRALEPTALAGFGLRFAAGLAFLHVAAAAAGIAVAGTPGRRLLLATVALSVVQNLWALADHARAYARNVRDTLELNVASGIWVRDHLPTGALVAVHDFGAIAYFGRRRVLDLEGIGSPEAIEARRKGGEGLVALIRSRRPTHYVGSPGGLRAAYGPAFKDLVDSGQLERKPLHEIDLPENATVAGGRIWVGRFSW